MDSVRLHPVPLLGCFFLGVAACFEREGGVGVEGARALDFPFDLPFPLDPFDSFVPLAIVGISSPCSCAASHSRANRSVNWYEASVSFWWVAGERGMGRAKKAYSVGLESASGVHVEGALGARAQLEGRATRHANRLGCALADANVRICATRHARSRRDGSPCRRTNRSRADHRHIPFVYYSCTYRTSAPTHACAMAVRTRGRARRSNSPAGSSS